MFSFSFPFILYHQGNVLLEALPRSSCWRTCHKAATVGGKPNLTLVWIKNPVPPRPPISNFDPIPLEKSVYKTVFLSGRHLPQLLTGDVSQLVYLIQSVGNNLASASFFKHQLFFPPVVLTQLLTKPGRLTASAARRRKKR